MKFFLFLENEKVGHSLLEGHDESMAISSGEFYPNENYQKYSSIFAEYTKVRFSDFPKGGEEVKTRMNELYEQINELNPKIITENGEVVEAFSIVLEDFSIEYDSNLYELAGSFSRDSFDKFFTK